MPWLQLHIDTHREQADRVEDALIAAGAVSVTLQDNADQPILEPALGETPLWNETRITGLFATTVDPEVAVATATSFFGTPLPPYRWEKVEDKNWEREWMQGYEPIQCSDKLWICPNWMPPPDPEATNLLLDPGLAFGTGTHP
ncbi:MAG: 50S ribosomal protein L11 methyltransferase, partial [Exilibacterium sp.]